VEKPIFKSLAFIMLDPSALINTKSNARVLTPYFFLFRAQMNAKAMLQFSQQSH
jgi:hypothetical protein